MQTALFSAHEAADSVLCFWKNNYTKHNLGEYTVIMADKALGLVSMVV